MLQLDKHTAELQKKKDHSSFCTVSIQLVNGSVLNFAAVQ